MIKARMIALGLAGATVLSVGTVGLASAATTTTDNQNVGSSTIPRSVFKTERQNAEATVLNTSVSDIQAARKAKTFDQLLSKNNLTRKTFAEKVKAQLTTNLEAKGYSQQEVTIALQHKEIHHLRHERKESKSSTTTNS